VATVAEIMDADPVTVTPDTAADAVFHTLRDNELPGVPVVNDGGRVVGIITENDLVIADEQGDLHLPHYIELFGGIVYLESMKHFEKRLRKAIAATAEDLMTSDPVTIAPDATVQQAAKVIANKKHNRLPVVEHGRLVGVVTRLDVLDYLAHDDE
jgi:CBS domain-containing protein